MHAEREIGAVDRKADRDIDTVDRETSRKIVQYTDRQDEREIDQ